MEEMFRQAQHDEKNVLMINDDMEENKPLIQLNTVSKIYNQGALTVGLHKISLSFYQGEYVAITGSSGSGKSTLLNVLSCLDTFDDGEYFFKGESINYFNEAERAAFRNENVAFIFQDYYLIDSYTVYQNIELALLNSVEDNEERKKKVLSLIEEVGLKGFENSRGSKLSGGQKQRVSIARALAKDAPILFADEPTGNLDAETSREILELLFKLAKGKLVFIVTHSFEELEPYATRKIRLADGEVSEDEVLSSPSESENLSTKREISKKARYANLFRVGFYNIKATPKRTIFTLTSLAFLTVVFIWVFILAIGQSMPSLHKQKSILDNTNYYKYDLEITKKAISHEGKSDEELSAYYSFNEEDLASIKSVKGVSHVYPYNYILNAMMTVIVDGKEFSGYLRNASSTDVIIYRGRMPEKDNEIVITLPQSRKYTAKDWIGKVINREEFAGTGLLFSVYHEPLDYELTVCGVIVRDKDDLIITSDGFLEKAIAENPYTDNPYHDYGLVVTLDPKANINKTIKELAGKGYVVTYKYGVSGLGITSIYVLLTIIGLLGLTAIVFRITNGSIKDVEKVKSRDYNIMRTTGLDDWFIKRVYYVEMILTAVIGWLAGTILSYLVLIIYGFSITPEISFGFSLLKGYAGNISWINLIALAVNVFVTIGNANRFNRYLYKNTIKGVINNA